MSEEVSKKVPRHIALIMDGNRRWARDRNLPEVEGHRAGVEVIKPLINHAFNLGVEVLTFWAFSTKNFKRDKRFLKEIFGVFRETLNRREWFDEITEAGGKLQIIGNPEHFPLDIRKRVTEYLSTSEPKDVRGVVNFALEYEGRDEIVRAIRSMAKNGREMEKITQDDLAEYLDTKGLPDPDLVIRTGGEVRLSGYLLWQVADAELYFTKTLWPDFDVSALEVALTEYDQRDRRFGK